MPTCAHASAQPHRDEIPLEDSFAFAGPDQQGMYTAQFYAFNTVATLQGFEPAAYGEGGAEACGETGAESHSERRKPGTAESAGENDRPRAAAARPGEMCRATFEAARDRCRFFERTLSRTLPHSDISRLNSAQGAWVEIRPETHALLRASLHYCEESGGVFDITLGSAVRLWDFHQGIIPNAHDLACALEHVDWRAVELREEGGGKLEAGANANAGAGRATASGANAGTLGASADAGASWATASGANTNPTANASAAPGAAPGANPTTCPRYFARLTDPLASVDVGGTAKGFIADDLGELLKRSGISNFIVNLGGNVLASGAKPDGSVWRIGLQDPRHKREDAPAPRVLGAIEFTNASSVTSGVNERSFTRDGVLYHHILNAKTGYPVATDIASVTVIAKRSLDAEGYSTTLLALGLEAGTAFVQEHPAIASAYFIDAEGVIYQS